MAVDDLWFLRKPDSTTGERKKSKRHGRGKRWRVRWVDPETGEPRAELFERKADAERQDANVHADISRGQYVDPHAGKMTVKEYADVWRNGQLHRDSTAELVERRLRLHVLPKLGHLPLASVRSSHLKGWVKDRKVVLEPSTLHVIYNGTVVPMFASAVNDRLIGVTPCVGVSLPAIPDPEYYIATPEQVHALYRALPSRYKAIVYLAAGCGWRSGEIFGLEEGAVDFESKEVHVQHQLKVLSGRKPFLGPTKTKKSMRTNELPDVVSEALRRHLNEFPAREVELRDETIENQPRKRFARLVFTDTSGNPIHRANWSHTWSEACRQAGLPKGYGLRDLRHYFATVLIHGGANVKTVQLAMGHTTPTITLNTYVGYWPDAVDRTRSLVQQALGGCTESVPAAA